MKLYPHGPLARLLPDVWQVTGTHSLPINRNMVIWRNPKGQLILHSVVAVEPSLLAEIGELGEPALMIVPHAKHAMDAPFYKERFPQLKVAAPGQSRSEIKRRYGIEVDGKPDELAAEFGAAAKFVEGAKFHEYALELPTKEGICLAFNDAVASEGRETGGFSGWLMKKTGVPHPGLGVSKAMRWFTRDPDAFREFLGSYAARDDIELVTVSHGEAVRADCAGALARAVAGLT